MENNSEIVSWKKIITILFLGWTIIWISRTVLNPVLPNIKDGLNVQSDSRLALVFSSYFLAYTLIQIPAGIMSDKYGEKRILIPSFIIFAIASFCMGLAPSIEVMYIANFFCGLASGVFFACSYSLSIKNIPLNKRTFSNAVINSGTAIGMGIGMIGSTFLSILGFKWRTLLFITSAIIVIVLLIFIKFLPNNTPIVKKSKSEGTSKTSLKTILNLRLIAVSFVYFSICYGYYMMATWLPNFLQVERGFEGMMVGYISAVSAFSALPSAIFFGKISDKFNKYKLKIIVYLIILSAIALYVSAQASSKVILLIGLICYGFFGKLAIDPIIVSYVAEITEPKNYGLTLGIFNFFGMSGSVLSPYITAVVCDLTGSKVIGFYLSTILMMLGALILWISSKKRKSNELKNASI